MTGDASKVVALADSRMLIAERRQLTTSLPRGTRMYCEELDRLLDTHSTLTLEYFRQDVRTQGWYANTEEWQRECRKLQAVEEELNRVTADVADHRRQHGCGAADPLGLTTENTVNAEATGV